MRMYEELAALGCGGYDAVRRYAGVRRRERRALPASQAFVPLSFAPGEAYQFDWSHEYAVRQPARDGRHVRTGLRQSIPSSR